MKKVLIVCIILSMSFVSGFVVAQQSSPSPTAAMPAPTTAATATPVPATKAAAETPGFTISRMEIAGSVENREPVGTAESFPATQDKVFCYVELKDVTKDTAISFAWTFGQEEMGKVTQQIKKSARWRTWSSKTLGGMKGDWKVDVLDESGAVLKSMTFKVE